MSYYHIISDMLWHITTIGYYSSRASDNEYIDYNALNKSSCYLHKYTRMQHVYEWMNIKQTLNDHSFIQFIFIDYSWNYVNWPNEWLHDKTKIPTGLKLNMKKKQSIKFLGFALHYWLKFIISYRNVCIYRNYTFN